MPDIVDTFNVSQVEFEDPMDKELKKESEYEKRLQAAIVPKPYILSIRSLLRFYWDVVVIIFAIQNSVTLPLRIAFTDEELGMLIPILNPLDDATFGVFIVDIIFNFFTSYINLTSGNEIYDLRMITSFYVFSEVFVIDLLSTFPLDEWFAGYSENLTNFMKVLGMLKMQRIRRLSKIITNLTVSHETKALLKVFQMIFLLLLYFHIIACLWRFIINVENPEWIPPTDFIYGGDTKIYQEDIMHQYLSMVYHAIMIFGINEVAPRRENEVLLVVVLMCISGIANAYIFGEMANLVAEYDSKNIDLQENIDNTNSTMFELQISTEVQDQVRCYLKAVNNTMIEQNEFIMFKDSISKGFWRQIC